MPTPVPSVPIIQVVEETKQVAGVLANYLYRGFKYNNDIECRGFVLAINPEFALRDISQRHNKNYRSWHFLSVSLDGKEVCRIFNDPSLADKDTQKIGAKIINDAINKENLTIKSEPIKSTAIVKVQDSPKATEVKKPDIFKNEQVGTLYGGIVIRKS